MKCNCANCKYWNYVSGEWSIADSGCSLNFDWTKCNIHTQLQDVFVWEEMGN